MEQETEKPAVTNTPHAASDGPPSDPASSLPATIIAQLRGIRALVPDYTQLSKPERQALQTAAKSVNPDFVQASINGVGASPNVEQALGRTPEELRQETVDAQSWTAVEDELKAMLEGVATANLIRRHRIGQAALAAYAIARRLAQQKEHADLRPHVATMKHFNRFGKRKRSTPTVPTHGTPPPAQPPVVIAKTSS
jgi:hypothetical protein